MSLLPRRIPVFGAMIFMACLLEAAHAQVIGDEAELDRLKAKAEDAMSNEDAEGAAMSMGRAALMSAHLARKETDPLRAQLFKTLEHLSRSQEHGYRAIALFRRAGAPGKVGRQMQTWARFPDGWKVVAAHVSIIPEP